MVFVIAAADDDNAEALKINDVRRATNKHATT